MANPETAPLGTDDLPPESVSAVEADTAPAAAESDAALGMLGGGMGGGMADPSTWTEAIDGAIGNWFNIFDTQRMQMAGDPCYIAALWRETINRLRDMLAGVRKAITSAEVAEAREQGIWELVGVDDDAAIVAISRRIDGWARIRIAAAFWPLPPGTPEFILAVQGWYQSHLPSGLIPDVDSPAPVNQGGVNQNIGGTEPGAPFSNRSYGAVQIGPGIFYDRTVGQFRGTAVRAIMIESGSLQDLGGLARDMADHLRTSEAVLRARLDELEGELETIDADCLAFREDVQKEARFPLLLVAGLGALWILRR
jgi:hypothetical protein